jgi:hypothetical protein
MVQDMTSLYENAKTYAPKVKAVLRNKTIQGKIAQGKYAPLMERIAGYMEMVGLGHMKHDPEMVRRVGGSKSFKQWCGEEEHEHAHGGRIGMGMKSMGQAGHYGMPIEHIVAHELAGGATASEVAQKIAEKAKEVYEWLKANKAQTKAILESPYLNEKNPLGATDIPRKIKGYMSMVGLGRHGGQELHRVSDAEQDAFHASQNGPVQMATEAQKAKYLANKKKLEEEQARWVALRKQQTGRGLRVTKSSRKGAFGEDIPVYGAEEDGRGGRIGMGLFEDTVAKHRSGKGRQGGSYAQFVKEFAAKHPGPDLMRRAADAWKSR